MDNYWVLTHRWQLQLTGTLTCPTKIFTASNHHKYLDLVSQKPPTQKQKMKKKFSSSLGLNGTGEWDNELHSFGPLHHSIHISFTIKVPFNLAHHSRVISHCTPFIPLSLFTTESQQRYLARVKHDVAKNFLFS